MKLYTRLLLLSFLPLLFSCQEDDDLGIEKNQGEFSIQLTKTDLLNGAEEKADTAQLSTRAADISTDNFNIKIFNLKGTLLKEWARYSDVPATIKFGEGKYKLVASYGNVQKQGFDLPAYEGSSEFSIAFQDKKSLDVVCRLTNALISMEATEGMNNYFKDYTLTVIASGDSVKFKKGEQRKAYLKPADIKIRVTIVSQSGKTSTLSMPMLTEVKACDHYRLRLDVTDGAGNLALKIIPSDPAEEVKEIIIPSTEISTSTPYFSTTGFLSGTPLELIEENQGTAKILSIVTGGIQSMTMAVNSTTLRSLGWLAKIDLATIDQAANSALKAKLSACGLKWSANMTGNEMAEIDLSGITSLLKADGSEATQHSLTFQTTNTVDKSSLELPVVFRVTPPKFEITETEIVPAFASAAQVKIRVTKGDPEKIKGVIFYNDNTWRWDTVFCTPQVNGDICTLNVPMAFGMKDIRVKALYGNNRRISAEKTIKVVSPVFNIVSVRDITDNSATIEIETPEDYDPAKVKLGLINYILADNTGKAGVWQELSNSDAELVHDPANRRITVNFKNLTPSERYDLILKYNEIFTFPVDRIITGKFTFEDWTETSLENIYSGGSYGSDTWVTDPTQDKLKSPLLIPEPQKYWKTQNSRTASTSNKPQNTWTIVPSTLKEDNGHNGAAALLRSVGWDTSTNIENNFSTNILKPTSKSDVPIPKLKINTAGRIETTLSLHSKPRGLRVWYKFKIGQTDEGSKNEDQGLIRITLLDKNNNKVTEAEQVISSSVSSWEQLDVFFTASGFTDKVTQIRILCSSSILLTDGGQDTFSLTYQKGENPCIAFGSQLWVDDIELIY